MEEDAKATQEVAKTAGKAIDAVREFGSRVAMYFHGPVETGIGIVHDKLSYMRWERRVRLMDKADEFLRERGLAKPTRPVPMKFGIPLLQAGSLEEDDYLQDQWAALLANAADADSGVEIQRSFVSILENMGSVEVQIMEIVYSGNSMGLDKELQKGWPAAPDENISLMSGGPSFTEEAAVALGNLHRLGCLGQMGAYSSTVAVVEPAGHGYRVRDLGQTPLGRAFYEACQRRR